MGSAALPAAHGLGARGPLPVAPGAGAKERRRGRAPAGVKDVEPSVVVGADARVVVPTVARPHRRAAGA